MTSGNKWKPYTNKNLPRAQHSAFGDFPKDYLVRKNQGGVTVVKPLGMAELSMAAGGTAMLKRGDGMGGKTSSMNKPKPVPLP